MKARYVLSPEGALDLVEICRYISKHGSMEMAERVESAIREKNSVFGRKTRRWSLAQGFNG